MRVGSLMLASCLGAALLAPATAGATVVFDGVFIDSSTGASVNSSNDPDSASKNFVSLANVEGGVDRDATSSLSKTAGKADATSDSSAFLFSKRAGSFTLDQSADSSTKKASATSSGSAIGEVDYTFTLTGSRRYNLSVSGSAGGSQSGDGVEGDFVTELYDDTTSKPVWIATLAPGDPSFSDLVANLPNGKYDLSVADLLPDEPFSASSGVGGAGSVTMTDTTLFSLSRAAIPEPGTWALMGLGVLAVGAMARRRQAPAGEACAT